MRSLSYLQASWTSSRPPKASSQCTFPALFSWAATAPTSSRCSFSFFSFSRSTAVSACQPLLPKMTAHEVADTASLSKNASGILQLVNLAAVHREEYLSYTVELQSAHSLLVQHSMFSFSLS